MEPKVQSYFQKSSKDFDSIYSPKKNIYQKLVDLLFHRVIEQRFKISFRELGSLTGKRILDVGCGSGRYLIEAAKRGASQLTGLDFADSMLELARQNLERAGCQNKARLVKQDFLHFSEPEKYDFLLAIGFFDYVDYPLAYLQKMKDLATEKLILSFPKKWTLRTLPRWIRLTLAGCPVFFYDQKELKRLLADAKFSSYKLINLSRDYITVIDLKPLSGI